MSSFDPMIFDDGLFGAMSFDAVFDGAIFDSGIFDTGEEGVQDTTDTTVHGGGDSRRRRRRYRTPNFKPNRPDIFVMGRPKALSNVEEMTDIDAEIQTLLRKKLKTQDDETALILLLALVG